MLTQGLPAEGNTPETCRGVDGASCPTSAIRICWGWRSHRRVIPATSVKRNVTIPVGNACVPGGIGGTTRVIAGPAYLLAGECQAPFTETARVTAAEAALRADRPIHNRIR